MPNGSSLHPIKISSALMVAMPPLPAKNAKREAVTVSLTLLKSKDNLAADGKS
jgi:hypothetical protein